MFTDLQTTVKARFTGLQFRANPIHYTPKQQAKITHLAQSVRSIRPGVYRVGECFIDLFRNACSCRVHRIQKKQCIHRAALWLAEGVQLDDQDPAAYLKAAGVEAPEVVAVYGRISGTHGLYRIELTGGKDGNGKSWFECFPLDGRPSTFAQAEGIHHLAPFYE